MPVYIEKNTFQVYTSIFNVFFQILKGKWMLPS